MFWLRNIKKIIQLRTLIWGPGENTDCLENASDKHTVNASDSYHMVCLENVPDSKHMENAFKSSLQFV